MVGWTFYPGFYSSWLVFSYVAGWRGRAAAVPTCVRPTRGRGSFCEVHSPGGGGAHRVWPRTLVEPSLPPSLPRGHAIHSCLTICRAHGPPTILLYWHTSILDGIHILFESTGIKLCGVCSQLRLRCWIGVPARERRGGSCCWHLSSRRWRPLDAARGRACAPPRRVAGSCPRSRMCRSRGFVPALSPCAREPLTTCARPPLRCMQSWGWRVPGFAPPAFTWRLRIRQNGAFGSSPAG